MRYRDVRFREEVEQSKYVFGQVEMCGRTSARSIATLFGEHYDLAGVAAQGGPDLAGARAHAQVLASVQHSRLEQQHRRDRTDRIHSSRVRQLAVGIAKARTSNETAPKAMA